MAANRICGLEAREDCESSLSSENRVWDDGANAATVQSSTRLQLFSNVYRGDVSGRLLSDDQIDSGLIRSVEPVTKDFPSGAQAAVVT